MEANHRSPEFEAELKKYGLLPQDVEENPQEFVEKDADVNAGTSLENGEKKGQKNKKIHAKKETTNGKKDHGTLVRINSEVLEKLRKYHYSYCICEEKISMSVFLLTAVEFFISREGKKVSKMRQFLDGSGD